MCLANNLHDFHKKVTRPFKFQDKLLASRVEDSIAGKTQELETKHGYGPPEQQVTARRPKLIGYGQTGGRAGLQVQK